MIQQAKSAGIKVLLLTPTPDLSAKLDSKDDPLCQHAEQIRKLAKQYDVGLVDSLLAFQNAINSGEELKKLMSQGNHPNGKGHQLVAQELMKWFQF